ncbi:integral membrane channel protein [Niveomyces insectorum RCEF 264]|uniref:Integral membrane channel protein n=1 Tax=Niveomyces insectorum RCEF 264 TaxID=1081102 RepID=A0A167VG31_9HYPO|nr:integral membrane channel protein [Niveomyces insectorum RCEF 264]
MFSMLLRALHGSRSANFEPLPGDEPAPEPSLNSREAPRSAAVDSPSAGPATQRTFVQPRHATADFTEADDDEDDSNDDGGLGTGFRPAGPRPPEDEDGDRRSSHILPLFSASYLDSLPVYSIVHAMRIIVQARTETTLTWEQLRSPQVSQFLVKPMQQQIRSQHFSRATLYALMVNCLQFAKEGQFYPGNAGTSSTRAKVCELLAIKLLKEYTTRELIDALSYDFNPLQGFPGGSQSQQASSAGFSRDGRHQRLLPAARISTLEVAIRASAKHFLAHPLVVQQLEAIWNGAISFYSSADTLHRNNSKAPTTQHSRGPTASSARTRRDNNGNHGLRRRSSVHDPLTPLLGGQSPQPHIIHHAQQQQQQQQAGKEGQQARVYPQLTSQSMQPIHRRTVTLYDPRNASLFKLSRLRVPRYRQFLSTCSLAVLIGLFLAVLIQHSNRITSLELIFWFWSAGFMLDELVGFNEQGFSLYIMSFWNIFDLGILLLLCFYYSLRICGVFLADAQRWNDSAYDILAANAILLIPRIFSVLDHYQYFSQLLIAFRLMAVDLAAVFVLILVSCSGFFVFFTLSRNDNDPSEVAYKIFQLLMGFTPAAWEAWPTYNFLGKTLMALFLIICHFVVVTILITVLTNSFMAIASNANEEHHPSVRLREESVAGFQKDRALDEVFRRTPDIATLRTQRRNERRKTQTEIRNWMDQNDGLVGSPQNYGTINSRTDNEWARRMSVNRDRGSQKFRHVSEVRSTASDPADLLSLSAAPVFSRGSKAYNNADMLQSPFDAAFRDHTDAEGDDELVTNEDDEENTTNAGGPSLTRLHSREETPVQGGEGDGSEEDEDEDLFATPTASRFLNVAARSPQSSKAQEEEDSNVVVQSLAGPSEQSSAAISPPKPGSARRSFHTRALSTNTILYNPPHATPGDDTIPLRQSPGTTSTFPSPRPVLQPSRTRPLPSRHNTPGSGTPTGGQRSPRRTAYQAVSRPRPIPFSRESPQPAVADRAAALFSNVAALDTPVRRAQRRMSSFDTGTDAPSDVALPAGAPISDDGAFGAGLPGSFTSQLALATAMNNARAAGESDRDRDRMSRLVLARMKTLEESFTDVVRELRALQEQQQQQHLERMASGQTSSRSTSDSEAAGRGPSLRAAGGDEVGQASGSAASFGQIKQRRAAPSGARDRPHSRAAADSSNGGDEVSRGRRPKGKEVARPAVQNPNEEGDGLS